jgi:hypothetical protein
MKAPRIYKWEDDVTIVTETVIEYVTETVIEYVEVEVPGTGGETPIIPTNDDIKTPTEYLQYNKLIETKDKAKKLPFPTVYPDNYFSASERGNPIPDGSFDINLDNWGGTIAHPFYIGRLRDLASISATTDEKSFIEITPSKISNWSSSFSFISVVIVEVDADNPSSIVAYPSYPEFIENIPPPTPFTIDYASAVDGLTLTIPITNYLCGLDTGTDESPNLVRLLAIVGVSAFCKIGVYSDNTLLDYNPGLTLSNSWNVNGAGFAKPYVYEQS